MRRLFTFPDPVNEVSARLVAGSVVLLGAVTIATGERWLLVPLAYGFVARVLTGPTLSPVGQLVTRVITPALPIAPRWVPGPPKRFAQGIGATLGVSALITAFAFGATGVAMVLVALVVIAATLESVFGYCLGCVVFAALMRAGIVPTTVCERCADLRLPEPARVEQDASAA